MPIKHPVRVSCRIFNNILTALGVEFSKICLDREAMPRKRMLLVRDSAQIGKLSRRPHRAHLAHFARKFVVVVA